MSLTRKILRAKYGNQEGEKISMQNYSEDQEAGADINKRLEILMNHMKQKFMVVLVAESVEATKGLGVKYLENEVPVLLLDQLIIENPDIL